jgi:3-oxoacyl-[acyl-carrier-protein] synthase II
VPGEYVRGVRRDVVLTSAGVVTALGRGVEVFWTALLDGRSGVRPVSLFDPAPYQARTAAEIEHVPEDPLGETSERGHLLALAAASDALASCEDFGGPRDGLVVGTTLGGNRSFTDWLAGRAAATALPESSMPAATRFLARRTGARGPVLTVSVACASGAAALGAGAELIRQGRADRVLAGGYDALSEFVFSGFDSLRALTRTCPKPFDRARDGLALGEGAGFVLLEEAESAHRRGARPLAVFRGYASAGDAHHMTRPSPGGEGLARAVTGALEDAGETAAHVAFVSSHGTATPFNDRMEAAALKRVFGDSLRDVPVNSIKPALGHTLGAAGALEAIMTALVLTRGAIPPTLNHEETEEGFDMNIVAGAAARVSRPMSLAVSTSSAFGGTNAALVLERA